MTNPRFGWHDLWFGVFLVLVSLGTFAATWKLQGGSAADMGPGYFPRAIAFILLVFGLFFTGKGLIYSKHALEKIHWRPIVFVSTAVCLFAILVEGFGLAVACLVTIVVAALASRESRFLEVVAFSIAMSAAAIFLFIKVLALPVPIWPW